ncbi:MAG: glycine cleavage system protein GcvH [SAR202 cluster bacterium]|nr:glycine cleavage system protein GcvH [SAR202 cluster bacterium]
MMNPPELRYSKEHEWVRVDGGNAVIGVTMYAVESLGDVVYVDLPEVGSKLEQFKKMGEIESVKAVSDLFSPVSGEVVERNQDVARKPDTVNLSPYGNGWLLKVSLKNPGELDSLLTAEQYEKFLASDGKS